MKLELQLEDEVYERLAQQVGKKQVAAEILRRAAVLDPVAKDDRVVLLHGADRRAVEKILQTTLETSTQLVREMQNLSVLKIGTIERHFTASELVRLRDQAMFHGWTVDKFLELTSDEALRYVADRF